MFFLTPVGPFRTPKKYDAPLVASPAHARPLATTGVEKNTMTIPVPQPVVCPSRVPDFDGDSGNQTPRAGPSQGVDPVRGEPEPLPPPNARRGDPVGARDEGHPQRPHGRSNGD